MHFLRSIVTIVFAIAGIAAAHNVPRATPTGYHCDAQNILDACLLSTQLILNDCAPLDYACLCEQWGNVLTCYNNCPGDQGRYAVEASQTANCNAASLLAPTSTSTTRPSPTASSDSATATTTTDSASATSEASASASGSATQNAATGMRDRVEIGGLMALLAMGLGHLL